MEQGKPAAKPVKPSRPPSPVLPRLVALSAIVTLLAIPIVVPVVVMKTTHTSGKPAGLSLADAIEAPVDVEATPLEEDTQEELQESFLKISNSTVRFVRLRRARAARRAAIDCNRIQLRVCGVHWGAGADCLAASPPAAAAAQWACRPPPPTSQLPLPTNSIPLNNTNNTNKQFERFCRPYFTAGFNAYELVEAAMVSKRAETTGESVFCCFVLLCAHFLVCVCGGEAQLCALVLN